MAEQAAIGQDLIDFADALRLPRFAVGGYDWGGRAAGIAAAAGEPRFVKMEKRLAERPRIEVPSIVLHGADDGIRRPPPDWPEERASFTSLLARRVVAGAGHFVPREKPDAVSPAMLELL